MKQNKLLLFMFSLALVFTGTSTVNGQILYSEDFEAVTIPALGTGQTTVNPNGGDAFVSGTDAEATSAYWAVPAHGQFAYVNDDACNCDISEARVVMPTQDLTNFTDVTIQASVFYDGLYGGLARIEASTDGGTTWMPVGADFVADAGWQDVSESLSDYDGMANVMLSIRYDDSGAWATGLAVDDVLISGPCFVSEDFEAATIPALPVGYTTANPNGGDAFVSGTDAEATSAYWAVPAHGQFAYVNDDACNCDISEARIIAPAEDFTALMAVEFNASVFYDGLYGGIARVEASTDGGTTWTPVGADFIASAAWQDITVSLNDYAGMANVMVAVRYDDAGAWATGLAVDDICFSIPSTLIDANITSTSRLNAEYTVVPLDHEVNTAILQATVMNDGLDTLKNLMMTTDVFEMSDLNTSLLNAVSTPQDLNPGESVVLDNSASASTMNAVGSYMARHIVTSDDVDEDMTNDTIWTSVFEVSSNTYGRDDASLATVGGFGIGVGAGNDAIIGQNFTLVVDSKIDSIEIYTASADAGEPISVSIYNVDALGMPMLPAIAVSEVEVSAGTGASEQYFLSFTTPVNLSAGEYFFGANEEGTGNIGIQSSPTIFTAGENWVHWNGSPAGAGTFIQSETLSAGFAVAYRIRPMMTTFTCPMITSTGLVTGETTVGTNDGAVDLTVAGGSGTYSFEWSDGQMTEDLMNVPSGTYSVIITDDANGCVALDTFVVDANVAINDILSVNSILISPNPTASVVNISLDLNEAADVQLSIYDVQGRLIKEFNSQTITVETYTMNFDDYAAGVYVAKFMINNQVLSRRISVTK